MEVQKESIFHAAFRSFFKALFTIMGIFIAFIPIGYFSTYLQKDTDFAAKTKISILPDHLGQKKVLVGNVPVILQINIKGIIGKHFTGSDIQSQLLESQGDVIDAGRVKGVLIYVDSPGGSAIESDNIYRMILAYKQKYNVPVYVYVDGLCASGGMYVACSADKIYSSPVGIIGSVGVITGPYFNLSQAMEKWGIGSKTITQGKDKDMLSPFRPWVDGEDKSLQLLSQYLYERFVGIVTTARPMLTKTALVDTYGAQVFPAPVAQEYGYIDVAGAEYSQTLFDLLAKASVDATKPYQVVELKNKRSWFSDVMDSSCHLLKGEMKHTISLDTYGDTDKNEPAYFLYDPRR